MKKSLLIVVLLFLMFSMNVVKAEDDIIVYPFDSITITKAFHFEASVSSNVSEQSFLFGHVNVDENIHVYVGFLVFTNGGTSVGDSQIVIISNESMEDIVRWVINGSVLQENGFYLNEFSSHILVDPNIGIRKDLTVPLMRAYVTYDTNLNVGYLQDNVGTQFDSIANTYAYEDNLSIVISVNDGV